MQSVILFKENCTDCVKACKYLSHCTVSLFIAIIIIIIIDIVWNLSMNELWRGVNISVQAL